MFGVQGCAPLQNPAMWHLDKFTLCMHSVLLFLHTHIPMPNPYPHDWSQHQGAIMNGLQWIGWWAEAQRDVCVCVCVYICDPPILHRPSVNSRLRVWVTGCQCQTGIPASKTASPSPTITVPHYSAAQITDVHRESKTLSLSAFFISVSRCLFLYVYQKCHSEI